MSAESATVAAPAAGNVDPAFAGPLPAVPLARIAKLATVAAVLVAVVVLVDVSRFGGNPVSLVQPGTDGPSYQAFREDFPDTPFPEGLGFDGQMFYATARQPMHLEAVSRDLDRPRYRLQRPVLPVLAWAVHPTGGGVGLVFALFFVVLAGLVVGGIAAGVISTTLGGKAWPAFVYPLLPGCYVSLRTSVADSLAMSLALLAIALALRSRWRWAIVAGALAVLSKESSILVLVGFALWRRDRRSAALVAVPAAAAAGWFVLLHVLLPDGGGRVNEVVPPFVGLWRSVEMWADGREWSGMVVVVATFALAAFTLRRRGLRSPFGPAIALQVGFSLCLNLSVIGMNLSGTRHTLPMLALSMLALAVPSRPPPAFLEP